MLSEVRTYYGSISDFLAGRRSRTSGQQPCILLLLLLQTSAVNQRGRENKVGGKDVYTKGVSALKTQVPHRQKRVWCIPKCLVCKGKKRKDIYTKEPSRCLWGTLHAVLVYRFWPPTRGRLIFPQNPSPNGVEKWCSVPFIGVTGKSALESASS